MNIVYVKVIALLTISNVFMIFAWYGHLKFKGYNVFLVILVSWLIALPEYFFQVPANRLGHAQLNAFQLKGLQEIINLIIFVLFSILYLEETFTIRQFIGFFFMSVGLYFCFSK
ncbi:MAG: DMT family protein [Candidatus Midichloriaceae bacterium]